MKKVLNAVLLSVSMMISNAQAECPNPQTSQGGAWLLVASEAVRIRFEEKDGEYDIGLKIIGMGEEFKRVNLAKGDNSVVEIKGTGSDGDAVSVLFDGGALLIREGDLMMMRKADGSLVCSQNGAKLTEYKRELRAHGAVIRPLSLRPPPMRRLRNRWGCKAGVVTICPHEPIKPLEKGVGRRGDESRSR